MNTVTDADLMSASVASPAAFEEIVLRHHGRISRYVTRRLGVRLAEDVVSDVFATAFARRRTYDVAYADAGPWLFGIATNLIRRRARTEAAALRRYAELGSDPVAPQATPQDAGFDPQLAGVLADMRREHRDVLFLFAVAELSLEEIAAALDVPVGTVKSWLTRARRFAAERLTPRGPVGAGKESVDGHA